MLEKQSNKSKNVWLLTPLAGIILFLLLYIVAAFLYPGGSKTDPQARGFSLLHNYWCDLFDVLAHNGTVNPSRPIAIGAMVILTTSFGLLWYFLQRLFDAGNKRQRIMQWTGMGSMFIFTFLFTRYHEVVIHVSGLLGGIALVLTFMELYRNGEQRLFRLGLVCLALSCFNYCIYETGTGLFLLAGAQKLTFLVFFIWAALLNIGLYQKSTRA